MQKGIEIVGVSKEFNGKTALQDISLLIEKGTIHSIVGENGAGKSTLMNILYGMFAPTQGEVWIDGRKLESGSIQASTAAGVGMVFQHFMLIPTLSVWQNIVLGAEPLKKFQYVDKKAAIEKIKKVCDSYRVEIDMNQLVGDISVGQQQKVEILKILYKSAEYIVFDEPTAVLTPEETDMLFESMRALKRKGKTVVFISHKLQEVLEISDRISVLKNGRLTGTVSAKETNANELVKMMVGHVIDMEKTPLKVRPGETVFCAEKISVPKSGFRCGLNDIDFSIRGGEVLGVAGVDGNGQNELMDVILGIEKTSSGRLVLNGKDVTGMRSSERRKRGISCIPPDRHRQGIVLDGSIRENMILGCEYFAKVRKGFLIDREKSGQLAQELCTEYDVKMAGVDEKIRNLSGGNQQKVILARECGVRQSELIVAVNPTRGLDIGAMEFVYQMLEGYKKQGKAILLISTELTEIMRLSDNIAILFKGKIMDVLARQEADVKKIGTLMGGLKKEVGQNDGATIVH